MLYFETRNAINLTQEKAVISKINRPLKIKNITSYFLENLSLVFFVV